MIVIAVSLFAPLIFQLNHVDANSVEASEAALKILYLHDKFWLPVSLTLVLVALHSLSTTHKIAGPLYRFRTVFEAIRSGVLPRPVRLRKRDFLTTEMNAINNMLISLRAQAEEVQTAAAKLHGLTSKYGELANHAGANGAAEEIWNDLVKTENQLSEVLGRLKIER
jgi:nitrogen fixation/metabolism regulation signal transduction histidine kinase